MHLHFNLSSLLRRLVESPGNGYTEDAPVGSQAKEEPGDDYCNDYRFRRILPAHSPFVILSDVGAHATTESKDICISSGIRNHLRNTKRLRREIMPPAEAWVDVRTHSKKAFTKKSGRPLRLARFPLEGRKKIRREEGLLVRLRLLLRLLLHAFLMALFALLHELECFCTLVRSEHGIDL